MTTILAPASRQRISTGVGDANEATHFPRFVLLWRIRSNPIRAWGTDVKKMVHEPGGDR